MRARRLLALWSLLGCLAATAAESIPDTTKAAQPDAPVGVKPAVTTPPAVEPTPDAAPAPDPKPAAADAGTKKPDGDFKPSEDISEDMAVAYPVDI